MTHDYSTGQSRVPGYIPPYSDNDATRQYEGGLPGLSGLPVPPASVQPMYPDNNQRGAQLDDTYVHVPPPMPSTNFGYEDPNPYMAAGNVFDYVNTAYFGIRVQAERGLVYIGKRTPIAEYPNLRDDAFDFLNSVAGGNVYPLKMEEGVAIIRREHIVAITFFSYEWLDIVQSQRQMADVSRPGEPPQYMPRGGRVISAQ